METVSLTCKHCSAPLDIPQGAKIVKCEYCGIQLSIQRPKSKRQKEPDVVILDSAENRSVQARPAPPPPPPRPVPNYPERRREPDVSDHIRTASHGIRETMRLVRTVNRASGCLRRMSVLMFVFLFVCVSLAVGLYWLPGLLFDGLGR